MKPQHQFYPGLSTIQYSHPINYAPCQQPYMTNCGSQYSSLTNSQGNTFISSYTNNQVFGSSARQDLSSIHFQTPIDTTIPNSSSYHKYSNNTTTNNNSEKQYPFSSSNHRTFPAHNSNVSSTPANLKLPSIRELLDEINTTININYVGNLMNHHTTSIPIKKEEYRFENQKERTNTVSFTTNHCISNSVCQEPCTNSNEEISNYELTKCKNGITNFGKTKITKQKSTRYLSESANLILKQWLYDNWHNPYPDSKDKTQLSKLANITVSQVNNYFINARRRVCKKFKQPPSSIEAIP